jgi:O-antigen ligase
LGTALLLIVILSAIPLGSNRPFFWSIWASAVLGLSAWYLAITAHRGLALRVPLGALKIIGPLFVSVAVWMLACQLPIGRLFDASFETSNGLIIELDTLSVSPGDSWFALLRWLTHGFLFLLMLQLSVSAARAAMMSAVLVFAVAAEAFYALVALTQFGDTILIFEKTAYQGVATGTFVNRNSLATFLALGLIVAVTQMLPSPLLPESRTRRAAPRVLLIGAAAALIVAALLATQSRMGLFATGCGIVTVFVLHRAGKAPAGLPVIAGGIAILLVPAVLYGAALFERVLSIERAAEGRLQLYAQVAGMIAERPMFGYGPSSFRLAYPLFHEPSVSVGLTWDLPHSTYLSLWQGLGVIAGSVPVLIIAMIAVVIIKARKLQSGFRPEACAALGATVTVAVHSLVDFSLEIQGVAMLYTTILALGAAQPLDLRHRQRLGSFQTSGRRIDSNGLVET